jgi:hypothetical protein
MKSLDLPTFFRAAVLAPAAASGEEEARALDAAAVVDSAAVTRFSPVSEA